MELSNLFKSLFTQATVGIIVVDKQGIILHSNPYCHSLFGYSTGEMLNIQLEQLLPKSLHKKHVGLRNKYLKQPKPRSMGGNLDLYGQKKDGTKFPVEVSLSHFKEGQEVYAIAYINDNTSQKELLTNLILNEQRLDKAQKISKMGSFELDLQNQKVYWSKGMYSIHGIEPGTMEIKYGEHLQFVHPDDVQFVQSKHQEITAKRKGLDFSYRIIDLKNELRFVDGKRDVVLDDQGNVIKIEGSLIDVTQLYESKETNQDLLNIIDESLNEIYIFDAEDLSFLKTNKGGLKNVGYTNEELLNLTPLDLCPSFTESNFRALLETLIMGDHPQIDFETIHQRKDGSTYPIEVNVQYSKYGKRKVFVAFVQDISERKKHEEQLLEYSESLELKVEERTNELLENEIKLTKALEKEKQLGELKSRFVSMASHEFRTPLSTILSSSSLISRYTETDQQEKRLKHVKRINSSVKNLTNILNDFLSLEKLESGKALQHNHEKVNFKEFIQQIIEELNVSFNHNDIEHKHVGLESIILDEQLVRNIVINLLSNAIKYGEEKRVEITSEANKSELKLSITDQGIGIPKEDQEHMFTRFFRANNVQNIQGTGLGLTIIKKYLDLLKGEIRFESEEGKGTTFYLNIPLSM